MKSKDRILGLPALFLLIFNIFALSHTLFIRQKKLNNEIEKSKALQSLYQCAKTPECQRGVKSFHFSNKVFVK